MELTQDKLLLPMLKYPSFVFVSLLSILVVPGLIGCTTQKNTTLFQTIPYNSEVKTLITKDFEHKVKPDDLLNIIIVSPSDEIKNFNAIEGGYLVDKHGKIQMYKLGDIKVEGLTLTQVKEKIMNLLVPDYFKQASVSVRFQNHKVVVLGEVGAPGVIVMETEHLSVLEALAKQGNITANARRDNILVIRNTDNGKMFNRINLLDGSVFNSPYYYLQADDIIYVEPESTKPDKTASAQQIFSYVISGLSFLFLIFDRVNR